MLDYTLANNISVFNIKSVYNKFVEEMLAAGYKNILRNPGFTQEIGGLTYRWNSSIDLRVPTAFDEATGDITFTLQEAEFIRQNVTDDIRLNKKYSATVRVQNTEQIRVRLVGGVNDISMNGMSSQAEITIPPYDGTNWNVFGFTAQSRKNAFDTTAFAGDIYFEIISDSTDNEITFGGLYLNEGGVNLNGISPQAQILDNIRYRADDATNSWWEITHNGYEWHRLWSDDFDFEIRILDIFSSLTIENFLTPGDIQAGDGIAILPILDSTGNATGIRIYNTGGTGGGGGVGDWTKDDVNYQTMLEHSDYQYVVYDRFLEDNMIKTVGQSDWFSTDLGNYLMQNGATIETVELLPIQGDSGPFLSFFPSYDSDVALISEYTIDGTTWIAFNSDELVTINGGFSSLKLRFTSSAVTKFYSYGVLMGETDFSSGSAFAFREKYVVPADTTAPIVLDLPNSAHYHADGKSLQIFYNRAQLILGVDYNEVGTGISTQIEYLFDLEQDAEIVYQEYYGYQDASQDNLDLFLTEHTSDGKHYQITKVFYVDSVNGSDITGTGTEGNPFASIKKASQQLEGGGRGGIVLEGDATYEVDAHIFFQNSTVNIRSNYVDVTDRSAGLNNGKSTFPVIKPVFYDYDGSNDAAWAFQVENASLRFMLVDIDLDNPTGRRAGFNIIGGANALVQTNFGMSEVIFDSCNINLGTYSTTNTGNMYLSRCRTGGFISLGFRISGADDNNITYDGTSNVKILELSSGQACGAISVTPGSVVLNGEIVYGDAAVELKFFDLLEGVTKDPIGNCTNLSHNLKNWNFAYDIDGSGNKYQIYIEGGVVKLKPIY